MVLLPKNLLPKNALLLIKEYSKPLTRADWRNSKPIVTTYKLYTLFRNSSKNSNSNYNSLFGKYVIFIIFTHINILNSLF